MKTLRTFLTDQQVLQKGISSSQLNLDSLKKTIGENSHLSRQKRIEEGREYVQNHFKVLVNETVRGGRYLVERDNFSYPENPDF